MRVMERHCKISECSFWFLEYFFSRLLQHGHLLQHQTPVAFTTPRCLTPVVHIASQHPPRVGQCGRLPQHLAPALRRLLQCRAVHYKEQPAAFLSTAWAIDQQSALSEIPPCEQLFPHFPRIYCQDSHHSKFSAIQGIMGGTFSGSQTWDGGEFFGSSISVLGLGCCWSVHLLFLCSSKFSLLLSSQYLLIQIPRFFVLHFPRSIYCMAFVSD